MAYVQRDYHGSDERPETCSRVTYRGDLFDPDTGRFAGQVHLPCLGRATRWTPVEATESGAVMRRIVDPVCDDCDRMHYGPDHSVPIDEDFDWDADPRVLRYDREAVMGRFLAAIDRMEP